MNTSIYAGLFGCTHLYVRAVNSDGAKRVMRAAFGFSPKTVSRHPNQYGGEIGSGAVYDHAAAHLDGGDHAHVRKARVASRSAYAAGKGARLPSEVTILQF